MTAAKAPGVKGAHLGIPRPVRAQLSRLQSELSAFLDRSAPAGEAIQFLLDHFTAADRAPRPCEHCGAVYKTLHRATCPTRDLGAERGGPNETDQRG